ncbi:MAG: hypothetical protein AAF587_33055 [Bacteroidota bacterium]
MSCSNFRHPLTHNGTHQSERLHPDLVPENLQIDDRDTKAFLKFAYDYAALLKYYQLSDTVNGNWQCFFSGGALGMLSIISSIDLRAIDAQFCQVELDFWESTESCDPTDREEMILKKYQALIDQIYQIVQTIDKLCKEAPSSLPLKAEIQEMIQKEIVGGLFDNRVQNLLIKLIAFDKANRPQSSQSNEQDPFLKEKYLAFIPSKNNRSACTKSWGLEGLDDYYCITPDDGFIDTQYPDQCKENRTLRALFMKFFQLLSRIVSRAEFYLQQELQNSNAQEPQVSLFLAFIFLFRRLIAQLNQLTEAHLDYYYQQILCSPVKGLTPDQVFVIFELAKGTDSYRLAGGTLLDAGKDANGNKIRYRLDHELVLNKAKVQACQATLLSVNKDRDQYDRLYATSASQEDDNKSRTIHWQDFRPSALETRETAEIGIAISDPILKLAEGTRFIVIHFDVDGQLPTLTTALSDLFKVYVSSDLAEKGWLEVPAANNPGKLEALSSPSDQPNQGLTNNITYGRDANNYLVIHNSYDIVDLSSFSVRFHPGSQTQAAGVEIRILLKKDNFPINLPEIDDPLFQQSLFPLVKIGFDQVLASLLDIKEISNIHIATESAGIEEGIQISNSIGTFTGQDSFPLLGMPVVDSNGNSNGPSYLQRDGSFVSFELEELRGKQVLGMEPFPRFQKPAAPLPNELLYDGQNAIPRFRPRFQLVDQTVGYVSGQLGISSLPHLPHSEFSGYPVGFGDIFTLPPPVLTQSTAPLFGVQTQTGLVPDNTPLAQNPAIQSIFTNSNLLGALSGLNTTQASGIPGLNIPLPPSLTGQSSTTGLNIPPLTGLTGSTGLSGLNTTFLPPGFTGLGSTTGLNTTSFSGIGGTTSFIPLGGGGFGGNQLVLGPCIVYSALRNRNRLTLEYANEVNASDFFNENEPQLTQGVEFRYSSCSDFMTKDGNTIYRKKEFDRYHITPTGYSLINPIDPEEAHPILPEYYLLPHDEEIRDVLGLDTNQKYGVAHLDIGIKELEPGQLLSLLFEMEGGTGNPNYDPPLVIWSYLGKDQHELGDEWKRFRDDSVILDTTSTDPENKTSLLQSGLIIMTTPPDMTPRGTTNEAGKGLYWIRATLIEEFVEGELERRVIALPSIQRISAQAGVATFAPQDNDLSHVENGLAAEQISKLLRPVQTVRSVQQPMKSVGGRLPEDKLTYYRRVSERLRHKDRAINIWDYERLILEADPEVLHAKAISHTSKGCEIEPGRVLVAVFPNLKKRPDITPLTPRFSTGKLEALEDVLRERSNLFLYCKENIQVVNPLYEPIQVKACVRFRSGFSGAFYAQQLNQELHAFLAPWTLNQEIPLEFSGRVHRSSILNFMEERPYVDVVSHVEICHFLLNPETSLPESVTGYDIQGNPLPVRSEWLQTQTARSVLTTFPEGHDIRLWGEDGCKDCLAEDFTSFDRCISS